MTDCLNEAMRDRLPLLAHGAMTAADAAAVQAHVVTCAPCRSELELLLLTQRVLDASAPRVDTAAIVAALPAPRLRVVGGAASRSAARPGRPTTAGRWSRIPRQYVAAAASILIVASLASPLLRGVFTPTEVSTTPDTSVAVVALPSGVEPAGASRGVIGGNGASGISVAGGLGDLDEAELNALLAELDQLEATVASEPASIRKPIVETPEGL